MAFRAMEKMGATRVFDPAKVVRRPRPLRPREGRRARPSCRSCSRSGPTRRASPTTSRGAAASSTRVLVEEGWVVPGSVIAGGDSHTCTLRGARRLRHRARLDRHRRLPASGAFWQAVPGTIRVEFTGEKQRVRHRQGPDPRGDRRDRRRRRHEHGARVRRRRRRGALDRRAARRREHGRRGRLRDGLLPGRRDRRRRTSTAGPSGPGQPSGPTPTPSSRRRSQIDLDSLPPLVALPHSPGNVVPARPRPSGSRIDQVYIGNCSNGTMTDLRQAAEMLRGRAVHPRTPGDRRPGVAAGLPAGARGGPARRLRRGRRDGLDADLRRLLRRRQGRPRARRERDHDDEPQLPRPDGLERGRGPPRERLGRRRGRGRGRDRRPGGVLEGVPA